MTGAIATRLVVASTAIAVTLTAAVCALVIVPLNAELDRSLEGQARELAAHAGEPAPRGGRTAAETRVYAAASQRSAQLHGVGIDAAAWSHRFDAGYARSGGDGGRAWAVHSLGDGRIALAVVDRSAALSRRERLGLLEALALVLAGTAGWALWAGAAHGRRLGRVAAVARRVAAGDFAARAALAGRDEVARLGEAVDRMAERLGALERSRAEFTAKVSHDLRTPLTVIRGYAYSLERVEDDPEARRRLAAIGRESDRLGALVDDLLTLSQARAGALRITPGEVDAAMLLEEVEERLLPLARDAGVGLAVEPPAIGLIDGDGRRLAQALVNLGANAIRHTPRGATVRLAARPLGPETVELAVEDEGEGIEPAQLDRLLRPFEHGGGPRSGTGLGLSIVDELVRAHDGQLLLERRAGGGTAARVLLPSRLELPAVAR